MDPNSATTVCLGTLGASLAGTLGGASYALAKSQPPAVMGFAAGVNSGIAGLAFFALREYAVTPALAQTTTQSSNTLYAVRTRKLHETAISGALAGAGLNIWRRGVRGIVPGATTAALACTLIQYAINELSAQRIQYVAGATASTPSSPQPTPPRPLSQRIIETASHIIPLTRIDDIDYLERLERKRDVLDTKINRLERELLASIEMNKK